MRQVFKAEMKIVFGDNVSEFLTKFIDYSFEFSSSDGINGWVVLKEIVRGSDKESIHCEVIIETVRKRMYPDFEAYLNCIKSTLSHHSKLSVMALKEISNVSIRTMSDLKKVSSSAYLEIAFDADGDFYVLNQSATQKVIDCFSTLKEAEECVQSIIHRR